LQENQNLLNFGNFIKFAGNRKIGFEKKCKKKKKKKLFKYFARE
jgi:hypothetical protein